MTISFEAETPNVVKLATVDVNVERREEVRAVFKRLSESEDLESTIVIARRGDGTWMWDMAGNVFLTDMLGKIEIVKAELIAQYLESLK